jgi:hypothetical protein
MFSASRFPASRHGYRRPFPVAIRPTGADIAIARAIARNTAPAPERISRALTWGADEKVLLTLATAGWILSRGRGEPLRRAGNHALLVTAAASLLPHVMKSFFDQTRPDRMTLLGHIHGVSFSGKREDAFPSGHALHMGALASAAGAFAGPSPTDTPGPCDRPLFDARLRFGALGERRRRRLCAGSNNREGSTAVDRICGRHSEGDRSCQSLRT